MPDQGRPATGPVILEQIIQIEARLKAIEETELRLERGVERRYQLLDQFIDPAMNLAGTLAQVIESQHRILDRLAAIERALREEHRTTRGALALHLGDPSRARERGC